MTYQRTRDVPLAPPREHVILILAGSWDEARRCARCYGLGDQGWRHVTRMEQIRGLLKAEIWVYGTWYTTPHVIEMLEEMRFRNFIVCEKTPK